MDAPEDAAMAPEEAPPNTDEAPNGLPEPDIAPAEAPILVEGVAGVEVAEDGQVGNDGQSDDDIRRIFPVFESPWAPLWTHDPRSQDPLLSDDDAVLVSRGLLRDIVRDGTCPLHLRMQIERALLRTPAGGMSCICRSVPSQACSSTSKFPAAAAASEHEQTNLPAEIVGFCEELADAEGSDPKCINALKGSCLALIVSMLPLTEVLTLRTASSLGLSCAMQRAMSEHHELMKVHNRIRARLWIQRVMEVTKDTPDESQFENQVRSFANDALRRRMEAEMADAKIQMERQILAFQGEVDRRMEEQALRVHTIVEERVQQQLDNILAAEMQKVRTLVEERVQERVRAVVQREVHATVYEVHTKLAALVRENDRLRHAFDEHADDCFRSLVWMVSPNTTGLLARTLRAMWCCRRSFSSFSSWILGRPADRRQDRFRQNLDTLRRISTGNKQEARQLLFPSMGRSQGGACGSSGSTSSGSANDATAAACAASSGATEMQVDSPQEAMAAQRRDEDYDPSDDEDEGPRRLGLAEPPDPDEDEDDDIGEVDEFDLL